jgi:hypothetical protein
MQYFEEKGNPGVSARFLDVPILQVKKSLEAGKNIYEMRPHVEIIIAGAGQDVFVGPVTDKLIDRFPDAWEAYEAGEKEEVAEPEQPKKRGRKPKVAVDDAA